MALSDYRLCDLCGGKAFYDANLNYETDGEPYRIAGEPQAFATSVDYVGDWAVLCRRCAKTHRTAILPIAPEERGR